ncbi:MAG: glycosyltransferase [Mycobacteriaceae bacterium]|nr:glycosyltransferase [Mycobacteriaceae bacterium]
MKVVLASWGSRGEVEPCAAVGRELLRRGHEVCIALPPDLVWFAEAAGLDAVAYGPNIDAIVDAYRDFWTCFFGAPWRLRDLARFAGDMSKPVMEHRDEMSATLASLAEGADLLITGTNLEEGAAANVAEYHDIPLATLHWFPLRANGRLLSFLPARFGRAAMRAFWSIHWRLSRKAEDAQRRQLGLPNATGPWSQRITERGSLEIQAYDEACFPGLAAEWAKFGRQRPFVGALTMEWPTDADDEVASWIAAGTPPIFFGFGSIPVESPANTVAMISEACVKLRQRALICSGSSDFNQISHSEHVKVVRAVNYAATFPLCRAVVHHGGAGTTAIGLRAGVPTLILSTDLNQTLWGARLKSLKVGTARRFSATTQQSLIDDLRKILSPQYIARAREISSRMTKPADCIASAADFVEDFADSGLNSNK